MPMPKWLVVARNEYRVRTGRVRRIRPYLPFLVIGLLAVHAAFIAPAIVNLFIDALHGLLLSQAAVAMVQIVLFMIFFYFIVIPITETMREVRARQLEIFLSAPIKASDVLVGEYLGEAPVYAILVAVMAGFFVPILNPLGLSTGQTAIIITIFVVTCLSALWIGIVIAALLRSKLESIVGGKDIGRAIAMIIPLPLLAVIYAMMGGGLLKALADPGTSGAVTAVLGLLPSSWGAEVIVSFATNPGNIGAAGLEPLARFGGLIVFFVAALWVGAKLANRAYSIEPTSFSTSMAKPDGVLYKTIRRVGGGGSFGTLLVTIFKDYGRRLENLSNIAYMLGILVLAGIFMVPRSGGPDGPPIHVIMPLFVFPILVVMISGNVTVQGKENLFIYRKTPFGLGRYIRAMLLKGWLLMVPISGVATAVMTVMGPQTTLFSLLTSTGLMMVIIAAYVAFVLGLFLLNPAFSEKSSRIGINVMITMFLSIGLFIVSIVLTMGGELSEPSRGILYILLLQALLSWLVGILFLFLGMRKLGRME